MPIVVRYQTKADHADENQELIEAVFTQLKKQAPGGVQYAAFRLADGTFVHVADVTADPNPLNDLPAFQAFVAELGERCEPGNGPNPQPAVVVGNYELLTE